MYTINNYTPTDWIRVRDLDCQYNVMGKEVGATGTPHIQGCVTFKTPIRFKKACTLLGGHLTRPKHLNAARKYCMKDGDYQIIGQLEQGKRTDLLAVYDSITEGKSLREIANSHPSEFMKYHGGISRLISLQSDDTPRTTKPFVIWLYGATGTGKTRYAFHTYKDIWNSSGSSTFFNGYRNQPCVLWDDFRGSFCTFAYMLKLLDRYPMKVNVKHGFKEWNPKVCIITSSKGPKEVYDKCTEDQNQLYRRIDCVVRFNDVNNYDGLFPPEEYTVEKGTWTSPVYLDDLHIYDELGEFFTQK